MAAAVATCQCRTYETEKEKTKNKRKSVYMLRDRREAAGCVCCGGVWVVNSVWVVNRKNTSVTSASWHV